MPTGVFPVLQTATSGTETNITVLVPEVQDPQYTIVAPDQSRRRVHPKTLISAGNSGDRIETLWIDQLIPGSAYVLEIRYRGTDGSAALDRRIFRTFATDVLQQGVPLRVALISCMNDRYEGDQAAMWDGVAIGEPELVILNGDCCYVDKRQFDETEYGVWRRHVETRRLLDIFKWDRLVPIFATWDDHDTAVNDSDSSNPWLPVADRAFSAMFGFDAVAGMAVGPGRTFRLDIAGMRFLFLDDRSFMGADQIYSTDCEEWILSQARSAPGPLILVNGIQFFGGYLLGSDSFEKHAQQQLKRLCAAFRAIPVPVLFATGDVHFSEIMRLEPELLGYTTYELTSSSIHSRSFPGMQYRSYNRRRLVSTSSYNHFAIEFTANSKDRLGIELYCLGAQGERLFEFKNMVRRDEL